ncbi:MAG: anti-sigma factor [Geminicoccaceae bacterium]
MTEHDLHAFVDGELDGRRYREVVARLASDSVAAERVNGYLRQQGDLAGLREQLSDLDPMPDETLSDLTRQLAGSIRHQRRVRASGMTAALAASFLVGVVTWWGPNPSEMAQRFTTWRQVAESGPQMLFGRDPLNGSMQLITDGNGDSALKLDEQLAAYSIRRPDLAAHGLTFVGGDAIKGGESPAIRLVYADDKGNRVFLFVGTIGSGADVALTVVPEGHVSLNWRRGSLVFALIGPKDSDQLLDVMAATSEMLSVQPGGGEMPVSPAVPATGGSGLVAGTVEGGVELPTAHSADTPAGMVQPAPGKLGVTPVVAEPL